MKTEEILHLDLRSQVLAQDAQGHTCWQPVVVPTSIPAHQTAIIICDMWDRHWSRGATERVEAMVSRMNRVIQRARARGVRIVHAPSETMDFYAQTAAHQRMIAMPRVVPPEPLRHADPPLPIDASDGGSDTGEQHEYKAWSRQHPAIEIGDEDGISDDGLEIYSFLRERGINLALIMGVHTNMCILNRSFGIKALVKWDVDTALVRDLTDTMYNPALPPYVAHEEGTRLVVEYIEKFWCPTLTSEDLMSSH
jgi:nicotinamidase-related amidase